MTPRQPDISDAAALAEYWKQIATAAVDLAKTEISTSYKDSRSEILRAAAREKADDDEFAARRKAEGDTELELHKQVLLAMVEVAKGSIERSRDSAKFVQTVSAALAGAYTTILALVFAAKDNPLPARGFIPTIFFGLAAGLATAYLAFLMQGEGVKVPVGSSLPRENSLRKVVLMIRWTGYTVHMRAPFLRGAVCALLLGIAFLPVAVIEVKAPPAIPFLAESATSAPPTVEPVPTATATPAAGAAESPSWPPAPPGAESGAASVELYKAQLIAHLETLKAAEANPPGAPAVDDSAAERLAWRLAVAGSIIVGLVAVVPFGWRWVRRPRKPRSVASGNGTRPRGGDERTES